MLVLERSETHGNTTLHFFADKVIGIQYRDSGPPRTGEIWLIPRDEGTSRFAYCPPNGLVVFYHTLPGEDPHYHGGAMNELRDEFDLDWPHYDKWVRGIVSRKAIKFPIVNLGANVPGGINEKRAGQNLRKALSRLVTLGGIPDDYLVRIFLGEKKRMAARVKDWVNTPGAGFDNFHK